MSGGGNNFSNGQFGGLPLGGGGGGQGTVPGRPQVPGQGGGFGQRPPMMGNRPMYATPFTGMPQGGMDMQASGGGMPGSTASPYGGPASGSGMQPQSTGGGLPPGVSMGFQPQGNPYSQQGVQQPGYGMSSMPPRLPPMQAPDASQGYGSDFLYRAMRGG